MDSVSFKVEIRVILIMTLRWWTWKTRKYKPCKIWGSCSETLHVYESYDIFDKRVKSSKISNMSKINRKSQQPLVLHYGVLYETVPVDFSFEFQRRV